MGHLDQQRALCVNANAYEQMFVFCFSRAALLDALQKVGMRWRPMRQRWASNILLSTHGRELTRLKSYVDDGDDYQTLYKMVYNDFQGETQRSVLQHISTQGQVALQELQTVAPTAPPGVCLKVRAVACLLCMAACDSVCVCLSAKHCLLSVAVCAKHCLLSVAVYGCHCLW